MKVSQWLRGGPKAAASKYVMYAICMLCALPTHSQQSPDAGGALRQSEQQRLPQLPTPGSTPSSPAAPTAPTTADTGPTVVLSAFEFAGNERYSAAQLQPVLASYLNRPLHLPDLESAAATIAQFYRSAGWMARVIVPPQQVQNGVLRLQVIEAEFGGTRFSDDTDQGSLPLDAQRIVERVQSRQDVGQDLHIPSVERGLLLANDLPGVSVTGSQMAGQREGQTDVLLRVMATPRLTGELTLDNEGSRATGSGRVVLRTVVGNVVGIGDELDLQAQLTPHLQYVRLGGSLPIGVDGLRAAVNVAALHYEVGTPEFSALDPHGNSKSAGAELSYPLIRASSRNLYVGLAAEYKQPYNATTAGVTSDYAIRNAVLRLDGNLFDTLGYSGISTLSLSLVRGKVDLDGSPNAPADAMTARAQGSFSVLRYRATRTQNLNERWSLYGAVSGQYTGQNLDSAEKFYLGGASGVRAYPVYEGGGAKGRLLNVELRRRFAGRCGCELKGFYDRGRTTVNADNDFAGAPQPNRYRLSGYGLGLDGAGPWQTRFSLAVAWRDGHNPNPTSTGHDQDGTLRKPRYWASVSAAF